MRMAAAGLPTCLPLARVISSGASSSLSLMGSSPRAAAAGCSWASSCACRLRVPTMAACCAMHAGVLQRGH